MTDEQTEYAKRLMTVKRLVFGKVQTGIEINIDRSGILTELETMKARELMYDVYRDNTRLDVLDKDQFHLLYYFVINESNLVFPENNEPLTMDEVEHAKKIMDNIEKDISWASTLTKDEIKLIYRHTMGQLRTFIKNASEIIRDSIYTNTLNALRNELRIDVTDVKTNEILERAFKAGYELKLSEDK